ncbi:hypothetical protein LTR55_011568, partial [Exophiala xenobiotica]
RIKEVGEGIELGARVEGGVEVAEVETPGDLGKAERTWQAAFLQVVWIPSLEDLRMMDLSVVFDSRPCSKIESAVNVAEPHSARHQCSSPATYTDNIWGFWGLFTS